MDDLTFIQPDELEVLTIKIKTSRTSHFITSLYRPPRNTKLQKFYENLENLVNKKNAIDKNATYDILGDFNINLFNSKLREDFFENSLCNGLLPIITRPTRITENTSSLIDNILTNDPTNTQCCIMPSTISDHFHLILSRSTIKQNSKTLESLYRPISDENLECLKEKLSNFNWNTILSSNDPHYVSDLFLKTIQTSFEHSFPAKTKKQSFKQSQCPWINKELKEKEKEEMKLYLKKVSNPTLANIHNHKTYKKDLKKLKRSAKQTYYKNILGINYSNPKKTWQILNSLRDNNKKTKDPLNKEFKINGDTTSDTKKIADGFNIFFTNIGPTLGNKIKTTKEAHLKYIKRCESTFKFEELSGNDILNFVSQLKPKLSSGPDGIPTKIIKQIATLIKEPLTHFINLSLRTGYIHPRLKEAKVIQLFKSGDKDLFTNHRPISLLNAISKLLEKVAHHQLYNYLDSNNIISEKQFGFRTNHSTTHAMLDFINHIYKNIINQKHSAAIFIDLSKAFDTTDHEILLSKLEKYGIRETELLFFKNYLTGRKQYTVFYDTVSEWLEILCGVPQGSILGPLLFIIYINDFPKAVNLETTLFADDTTLIKSDESLQALELNVNQNLKLANDWFTANKLTLNVGKTKVMLFSHRIVTEPTNFTINNIKIEQVGEAYKEKFTKFLGFHLDENLSWKYHIEEIRKKASSGAYILYATKNLLDTKNKLGIYHALVSSHLNYGISVWGDSKTSYIKKIETIQRKATRSIVNGKYNAHTEPIFRKLKILKFKDMVDQGRENIMFAINKKVAPIGTQKLFQKVDPSNRLRQNNLDFEASFTPDDIIGNNFPQAWNKLSDTVKSLRSKLLFKKQLKDLKIAEYKSEMNCPPDCYICHNQQ